MYGFLKNLRFFDAFFILFLLEKGISFTQIGLLYAIREVITNLFELPSGILADTFGRKKGNENILGLVDENRTDLLVLA